MYNKTRMEPNPLEKNPSDLAGMSPAEAKEYIFGFITTLKLTENEIKSLENEAAKWNNRIELARSKNSAEFTTLMDEAVKEAEKIKNRLIFLREEESSLKKNINIMKEQLPGLAALERSIDPDLLEQELLMALGQTEEEAKTERAFRKLEKEKDADSALEALKSKMKNN